jgi:hypothetical protein
MFSSACKKKTAAATAEFYGNKYNKKLDLIG